MYDILFQPVDSILSIKDNAKSALSRLGIKNLRDLLFYCPSSFCINDISSNLSNLYDGKLIQAEIVIHDIERPARSRMPLKIQVGNDTGDLTLLFFNKIPPFIFNKLQIGSKYTIAGKVQFYDRSFQITHPDFIFNKHLVSAVIPIYPLTYGMVNKQLYGYILQGIESFEAALIARRSFGRDISPDENLYMQELLETIKQLHLFDSKAKNILADEQLKKAIETLAFKELLANQVSLLKTKTMEQASIGRSFSVNKILQQQILDILSFELTPGQLKSIEEIEIDQQSGRQMMRLLQGDVGSGKTLVALLTMVNIASSKVQSALMAPTDLLSNQHYQFFTKALENIGFKIALLTGKTSVKEKEKIKAELENGDIDILIGTHALFQAGIKFKDLGYIIIDEQHRFGVEQRLELINKASHPDVLVMTATPIPRSLTLTIFGDMDVSQITTKPKNRLPIITSIISIAKKFDVIDSLSKKIELGEKIYWVCPLIDQNDKSIEQEEEEVDANVMDRFNELESFYPGLVGVLHGKTKLAGKDQLMQSFKEGKIKILVATTVIEVGIDVPDSTLMIIENAEKFGLAQLHQLRGRVGRGELQSFCIMLYNPKRLSKIAKQRLEIMRLSQDGFYIAEQDLVLRGGGEILGTKQSGEPEFFFANLGRDLKILISANNLAKTTEFNDFIKFQIELFNRGRNELVKSG